MAGERGLYGAGVGGSSEQVHLWRARFPPCLLLSMVEDLPFGVSAPASGAPAGRLGPWVQMGNCMPNHPFRHPLICFPHANMGFLQMDLIYLLLPHFI